MDFNDYWQENKRFVYTVLVGLVVFLFGYSYLSGHFGDQIKAKTTKIAKHEKALKSGLFTRADLDLVTGDNEGLLAARDALEGGLAFVARPEFTLAGDVSPANQYLRALADVRDDILPKANRASVRVDEGLGLPKLSPTKPDEIVRYLEALDVIDAVVSAAIDSRVRRIEKMQVRLDPGLDSKAGVGRIEKTQVNVRLVGSTVSLVSVMARTQRSEDGRVLPVGKLEMTANKQRPDEVQLDVTFHVVRLHEDPEVEG